MPSKALFMRGSIVVGLFSLLGNLTGILVEASIAAKLGLSRSSDTFYFAFTIPYIISNLINATGQFSLVPFFAAMEARHSVEELWRGFSYAVNVIFLGLGAIAAVGAATTPWLIRWIGPGLTAPQIERATQLGQWLFLMIIPAGVAEALRSFLLSQHRFALPSAAGLFRNITVILFILFGFGRFGEYSIVFGYLSGTFLQVVLLGAQIGASFRVRYSLALVGSGEAFRNLRGAGAVQMSAAVGWQSVVIVERIIASFLPPGTLTAFNYGFKILSSLSELLAGSVGTASLPALSRAVALAAEDSARKTFQTNLKVSLVLVCPATLFCLLLDRPIIRLFFERGSFTPQAAVVMSAVFFYYSLSLPLYAAIRVLTFYLFARQEPASFLRLAAFLYASNIAFDLGYVGLLRSGAKGVPLGLLSSLALVTALAYRRNLAGLRQVFDRPLGVFTAKNLLCSALAGLAIWGLRSWIELPRTDVDNFLYLCKVCGAGSLVFFGALALSKAVPFSQLSSLWRGMRDRSGVEAQG